MAAPVIQTIQSVLEYLQHQAFEFQPYATNDPTWWTSSPLPDGLTFETDTGRIAGACALPGVYVFALTAGNGDGASDPELFTLGVEASSFIAPVDAVDVVIELGTGAVSISPAPAREPSVNVNAGKVKATDLVPLLWMKRGDTKLFHIRFVKGGVTADIDLSALKLSFKAFDPESALITGSTFERAAEGADTYYRLAVALTGTGLTGELGNNQRDFATHVIGLAEFEWLWVNDLDPAVASSPVRSSSLNFAAAIVNDLAA